MTTLSDPHSLHRSRLAEHQRTRAALERVQDRLGIARLTAGGLGALLLIPIVFQWIAWWWIAAPFGTITALSIAYERGRLRRRFLLRAEAFHQRGISHFDNTWPGRGEQGSRYHDEQHVFAADLDLFGPASLFEHLCTARTRAGQDLLAGWLKQTGEADVIRARQEAVDDLRGRLDLRERLAVLGEAMPGGFDTESLAAWASRPPILPLRAGTLAVHLLTAGIGLTLLGAVFGGIGFLPFLVVVTAQSFFVLRHGSRTGAVLKDIEKRAGEMQELSGILQCLERETFTAQLLRDLQESLCTAGEPPSRQLARLARLIDVLNSRRNQLFIPLAMLLMWGTRLAFAIDAWRVRSGPAVRRWFDAIAEIEALLSLAGFAFEHPQAPFPEIVGAGRRYRAVGLRHPLMPRDTCVPNDIDLDAERCLLIISGSNMSGKSTFLRTVGINAVLALAGGPVLADAMTITPLTMGATLRIQDSLMAGKSRFYAEITRIRQVMALARQPRPLLFLFDEILHGTNSHDRGIGSAAIVRALVEQGALGLVTTHDLALARVADELAPRAANVHFADHLEDGKMVFDYRMQPGVVRHSNAIALMRAVGLPV